jgi:L-threonylcarbamoyladenylate synthase
MSLSFKASMAARVLRGGGVIAYPTEAIWGLGCDPDNPQAAAQLLHLKQRDPAKGLILVASSIEQCSEYLDGISPEQLQTLQASWPGPHTFLVPDNGRARYWLKGEHDRIALRVSAHPVVRALCDAFGGPVISTSANISGQPPVDQAWKLKKHFKRGLDFCLTGPLGGATKPSQITDLVTGQIIRQG